MKLSGERWVKKGALAYMETLPVFLEKGTVIDIETTGIEPRYNKLVCMGVIASRFLTILLWGKDSEDDPIAEACGFLRLQPRPYIAYYKAFEESWLGVPFDIDVQPFEYARKEEHVYIHGLNGHRGETVPLWYEEEKYEKILFHNRSCLLKELFLYIAQGGENQK